MPLSLLPSSSNKNAIEVVWAVAGEKNLIDKAYIEYGSSPTELIYKTTPHYATLYIYHDTIVFTGSTTLFVRFVVVIMGNLLYLIPQSAIQYYTTFEVNVGEFHWNVSGLFPTTGGTITLHLTGGNYKAIHNYKNSVTVFYYDCDNFQRQLSTIGTETYNYIGNYGYPRINLGATSYWTDNQYYTAEMAGQLPLLTVTYKCVKPVYKLHIIFPDFLDPNSPPSIPPSNLVGEYDIETGYPYAHVSVQLTEQCSNDQKDLANRAIKFSILPPTAPEDMAGHIDGMHTDQRPIGEFEDGTDECTTDSTGACNVPVNYLVPEVSGRYTIKAEMEDDASVTDEQKITVSVAGLDAIPLSPDNSYRLTGNYSPGPGEAVEVSHACKKS